MDLLTGSAEARLPKRIPRGIDSHLKCFWATTFKHPIHQAPANSSF
ncbi:MAG: hypothetical protein KatS3mg082_0049 [Nitrospiraceae bacterium]|nr:MAG: hypothetical protein KatS3mg082_0049 [Nitrospiraceae bacterium]